MSGAMKVNKVESLLRTLDIQDLYVVEMLVADLIESLRGTQLNQADEEQGKQQRKEDRFESNILGTLKRVTDIRPGERKEWCVNIQDISRSGMRFKVDTNFIPSRLVEITFAQRGGKVKQCFMEIVRMKKMIDPHGSWLEVGCRAVEDDVVRRFRMQEDRIAKMRARMRNKAGILILVIGPDGPETERITTQIRDEDYQVKQMGNLEEAMKNAERLSAQLAIFCNGSAMAKNEKLIKDATDGPARMATLAVLDDEKDSYELFKAGIDECLHRKNVGEFLFRAIERALIGHITRKSLSGRGGSSRAVIISQYNTWGNLMTYHLDEYGFRCDVVKDPAKAMDVDFKLYDVAFMDYEPETVVLFNQLNRTHEDLPLIALCDNVGTGHQAMSHGARNYLCMPPDKEDVRMILESTIKANTEC